MIDGDELLMVHGAQDLSPFDSGAYTGDVSGRDAREARLQVRRRRALRASRVPRRGRRAGQPQGAGRAQATASTPILCVGEGLDDPRGRRPRRALHRAAARPSRRVTAEQAADARRRLRAGLGHRHRPGRQRRPTRRRCARALRATLADAVRRRGRGRRSGSSTAARSRPSNVGEIVAEADVDGALVGGASLDGDEFAAALRDRRGRPAAVAPPRARSGLESDTGTGCAREMMLSGVSTMIRPR